MSFQVSNRVLVILNKSENATPELFVIYIICTMMHASKQMKVYLNVQKIVSEYVQEIPQSQTADNPMAPRERATQPSRINRKTNKAKQPALNQR